MNKKNIICKFFGHDYDFKKYDKKLNCPILKCTRCGKERLGYEHYVPKKKIDNKKEYITIKKYGNKANYAVEWMSLDQRYCRNLYEFKKDADLQAKHLNTLGRWNSGTLVIKKIKEDK